MSAIDLKSSGTSFGRELRGGIVTFMTMAYIIFVQPAVLSQAGMDFGGVTFATCISAAIATFIMGIYANLPIAQAPGMGENFFFTFSIVLGMGLVWQDALGAVFVAGIIFLLLSIFKVRKLILDAIPRSLRHATAAGIGIFIAFIGLSEAGIIVKNPGALVQLGDLTAPHTLLALFGLLVIMILMMRKVPGAVLWGILASLVVALIFGMVKYSGIFSAPPSPAPTFWKFSLKKLLSFNSSFLVAVFVFLYMDMFDTIGTLFAVSDAGNLLTEKGEIPRANRALISDAVGTVVGAIFGTSTVTSYIESTTGISAGARTGLSSIFVAVFFILALFLYPVIKMVGAGVNVGGAIFYPVTAPALIVVGAMMTKTLAKIDWSEMWKALPAFLTLIGIPFTYSIADGMALGFVSYPICATAAGKAKEVNPLMWIIAALFVIRYAFFK